MDNLVTISNLKENVLEFNVIINGIDTDDTSVRFVIEATEMDLAFDSEKGKEENVWSVKIPPLSILETTAYPFRIDVVVDGYHFDAMKGSLNVVGSHDIYATTPENITLTPGKKKAKIKDIIKKTEPKKTEPVVLAPKKVEKVKVEEPATPKVKPNKKFEMTPLKVEDGKDLLKTLNVNKKPERKTDNKLDDKIIDLMKKAKTSKKEETKPVAKKATTVAKKAAKPEKKIEEPKKKAKKKVAEVKKETPEKKRNAKNIAERIIETVTGLGTKKEETKDDKIKNIIKEEIKPTKLVAKKQEKQKEPGAIKKIGKDNVIVEVDATKEQNIKDILNEADDDTKSVTTKPLNKKNETIH